MGKKHASQYVNFGWLPKYNQYLGYRHFLLMRLLVIDSLLNMI